MVKLSPFTLVNGDVIMVPNLLFYQLRLIMLVLLCLIIHAWWPDEPSPTPQTPLKSDKPRRKRSKSPKPFTGLIQKADMRRL